MKLNIKIKLFPGAKMPEVIKKGDWIDLSCNQHVELKSPRFEVTTTPKKGLKISELKFDTEIINLGVAMKLPKGFEAVALPRSSIYKNYGIILQNSQGVIDHTYCGNGDEWKFPVIALRDTEINPGDRICQFRIQLSQKASIYAKIKWLFSSGIKLTQVEDLGDNNRGGIGSTGK